MSLGKSDYNLYPTILTKNHLKAFTLEWFTKLLIRGLIRKSNMQNSFKTLYRVKLLEYKVWTQNLLWTQNSPWRETRKNKKVQKIWRNFSVQTVLCRSSNWRMPTSELHRKRSAATGWACALTHSALGWKAEPALEAFNGWVWDTEW